MPFEIKLRHNIDYKSGSQEPRYFFELDLSPVLPRSARSTIPVYWRPNKQPHTLFKEVYWVEIAGTVLEKGNLFALEKALPEAIKGLLNFGTFPYYYFSLPDGERIPSYHSEGQFRLKLNGATISAEEIGELRRRLGERLLAGKRIKSHDDLEVSLLLWRDLRLYPTALAFSYGRYWQPVFYSTEGGLRLIYDVIGLPPRFLAPEEVFRLRLEVASPLVATRTLASPQELKIEQLREEVWQKISSKVNNSGVYLSYWVGDSKVNLPVYEINPGVCALEKGDGYRLYFADNLEELVSRVAKELRQQGKLELGSTLSIEGEK